MVRSASSIHSLVLLCISAVTTDVSFAWVAAPLGRGGGSSSSRYHPIGRSAGGRGPSAAVRASIATPRLAAAAPVPNPFQKLPWNVHKEQEREARRLKQERVKLHRQLGIAEDATYEDIVAATDRLLFEAGSNLKQKVLVEVAKDKILQYRLSERLAGYVKANAEARAQSTYELEGADDDDVVAGSKKKNKEPAVPSWTKGLIVKPDRAHLMYEFRLWGIINLLGVCFPPVQEYLGRFTWLICAARLTFRGMPKEMRESGGMGYNFSKGSGGGGHRKVAFGLAVLTWIVGASLSALLMPSWARHQRWTGTVSYSIQNAIFLLVTCYLQPYKGR